MGARRQGVQLSLLTNEAALYRSPCPSHRCSSTSLPTTSLSAGLSWSCVLMLYPRLQRTSVHCAPERRASGTRAAHSTVLFPTSCVRVVISLLAMVQVGSPFMGQSLLTRT